jgi:hypothetical protein
MFEDAGEIAGVNRGDSSYAPARGRADFSNVATALSNA